jgi:hypothetical protein
MINLKEKNKIQISTWLWDLVVTFIIKIKYQKWVHPTVNLKITLRDQKISKMKIFCGDKYPYKKKSKDPW